MAEMFVASAERDDLVIADDQLTNRVHFLWNQQRYLLENIKLADTKAGFVMTFAAALLSAGLSPGGRISLNLSRMTTTPRGIVGAGFAVLGVCGLIAAALYGAWSIKPRIRANSRPSPVSWVNVARYPTLGEFQEASRRLTTESAEDFLAEQLYFMSCICVKKHHLVSTAITLALCGGFCLALSIALH